MMKNKKQYKFKSSSMTKRLDWWINWFIDGLIESNIDGLVDSNIYRDGLNRGKRIVDENTVDRAKHFHIFILFLISTII